MVEPRDRLSRPNIDVTEAFDLRQRSIASHRILTDEPEVGSTTPFRWGSTALTGPYVPVRVGVAGLRGTSIRRGSFGTSRGGFGRGRSVYRYSGSGRENTPIGSGWRSCRHYSGSSLPSWYPRRPLQDITDVARAFERRRATLRDIEGQQGILILHDESADDPSMPSLGAQLEQESSMITPNLVVRNKCRPSMEKIPKILVDVSDRNTGNVGELTPQKKLLNSIDVVEKVVMEELRNMKKTPAAKRAEREKRVRTLMSMR